jgi:hypothetical protein
LGDLHTSKIVKCKEKMQNITSPTYSADTPKHMRSDNTNMAAYFCLWWQISVPMIQLLMSWTDTTTPVWFSLGHASHTPLFGSFFQSARQLKLQQKLQNPISVPWWIMTTKNTINPLTYYDIHLTLYTHTEQYECGYTHKSYINMLI